MANYFHDSSTHQLDKKKIVLMIEETAAKIMRIQKNWLKLYAPGPNSRKALIDQLIINEIVLIVLDRGSSAWASTSSVMKSISVPSERRARLNPAIMFELGSLES